MLYIRYLTNRYYCASLNILVSSKWRFSKFFLLDNVTEVNNELYFKKYNGGLIALIFFPKALISQFQVAFKDLKKRIICTAVY
jgi:hypothetical protein